MNCLFISRETLLDKTIDHLRKEANASYYEQIRFVMFELGGQGKSEICLKVARHDVIYRANTKDIANNVKNR